MDGESNSVMPEIVALGGIGCLIAGLWWIWQPLGLIAVGVFLLALAHVGANRGAQ